MAEKYLHIVSFAVPYPANYGGVINVFYKLKALHECGVKIILHCFEYDREPAAELEKYCEKVFYYKRKTGLLSQFSLLPYIVVSRKNRQLLRRLRADSYPILFEGLSCCYYLGEKSLRKRLKLVHTSNVEHNYYRSLAKVSPVFWKKIYYRTEACKLQHYEKMLTHADVIFAVSETEQVYFERNYPRNKVLLLPSFHANEKVLTKAGSSDHVLYHGALCVEENENAALWLCRNVFRFLPCRCVVAGMRPGSRLRAEIDNLPNVVLMENPEQDTMNTLIQEAHINVLITFQATGLKLKLLNTVFAGRHIVANSQMLQGSGLENACHTADTAEELIRICEKLLQIPFTENDIAARNSNVLSMRYSNAAKAKELVRLIFS